MRIKLINVNCFIKLQKSTIQNRVTPVTSHTDSHTQFTMHSSAALPLRTRAKHTMWRDGRARSFGQLISYTPVTHEPHNAKFFKNRTLICWTYFIKNTRPSDVTAYFHGAGNSSVRSLSAIISRFRSVNHKILNLAALLKHQNGLSASSGKVNIHLPRNHNPICTPDWTKRQIFKLCVQLVYTRTISR